MSLSSAIAIETGTLTSIQVGRPRSFCHGLISGDPTPPWRTGFVKEPIHGPVEVGATNLAGDGQADLSVHGGPDKAVLAYAETHYTAWQQELQRELPFGAFGENLTVRGLHEPDVCIGDTWQLGHVLLQVSQPRQPCWKLARRWETPDLPKRVVQSGRSGWYLRVLKAGTIHPGTTIRVVDRPHPTWTVARANQARYEGLAKGEMMELLQLPELATSWSRQLL